MSPRASVCTGALLVLLLVLCCDASGTRQLRAAHQVPIAAPSSKNAAAEAPGPAKLAPQADILFTLSAPRGVLTARSLSLTGVSVVQSFTHLSETAVYDTADFANCTVSARFVPAEGQWLGQPIAVLKATANNQSVSALLALSMPQYNASERTLLFQTKVLPATPATRLPTSGGAAERLIIDSANGLASTVLTSAPLSENLTNVGLFVDQNSQGLGAPGVAEGADFGGSYRGR